MVVDDDAGLSQLIKRGLARSGHTVATTDSGAEAVAWLKSHHADLLLLDLKLPDYEGPELLEKLKAEQCERPFIIITGQGDERVAVDMMRRGALDYLVKDISFLDFVPAVVERALALLDQRARLATAEQALAKSHAELELRVAERTEQLHQLNQLLEDKVARRTASLRVANEDLQSEIQTRRRLESELLQTSEREQQRIGRDLHDDLGQHLAGIALMSDVLRLALEAEHSVSAPKAAQITKMLRDALALTRSLARGLHPVNMEQGGLCLALADLCARSSELFHIQCTATCPPELVLEDVTATHLYHIAQEAITNAVKHGKAKTVSIVIEGEPESTRMTVSDDGAVSPASSGTGMGLRIMHYRADLMGGRVEFVTDERAGHHIRCVVPTAAQG